MTNSSGDNATFDLNRGQATDLTAEDISLLIKDLADLHRVQFVQLKASGRYEDRQSESP